MNIKPTNKVTAGFSVGMIVSTALLLLEWWRPDIGPPPAGLEGYLVAIASGIAAWLMPERVRVN